MAGVTKFWRLPYQNQNKNKQKTLMTYSNTLAMNRQRFGMRGQNSTSFRSPVRTLGPVSNAIILIVLACVLGLLYLTQVTKTNAYGYRINELQTQATELKQENDDLEVASARLQALDRVKNSGVAKNLVSVAPSATVQN
jgi:cell division protein FtsL